MHEWCTSQQQGPVMYKVVQIHFFENPRNVQPWIVRICWNFTRWHIWWSQKKGMCKNWIWKLNSATRGHSFELRFAVISRHRSKYFHKIWWLHSKWIFLRNSMKEENWNRMVWQNWANEFGKVQEKVSKYQWARANGKVTSAGWQVTLCDPIW